MAQSWDILQVSGFNPRAREGRDPAVCVMTIETERFQSTRPRGARPSRGRETP